MMSMYRNQMNLEKLDYLKEKQKIREEKQKIREEKEAYEEAFYKLSNEEQIIIRKVEGELIQIDNMDRLNKRKLKLEQMEKEEIKREKEEIKRLTKLIEKDRLDTVRYDQIKIISTATGVVGVLAYVGLTIITR